MDYKLIKALDADLDILINYKYKNIFEYASNLTIEEIDKIKNYVTKHILSQIEQYKIIIIGDVKIGCLLVEDKDDGVILDEIYIEDIYRNRGIGTNIINNIISSYPIVYLWVYKLNEKAISLYKRLGFLIIEETESRYYMKYDRLLIKNKKIQVAREFCKKVQDLAYEYNLPFFVVTEGASATSNNGCLAVKNARENHIKWEIDNGFDPNEDWSNDIL